MVIVSNGSIINMLVMVVKYLHVLYGNGQQWQKYYQIVIVMSGRPWVHIHDQALNYFLSLSLSGSEVGAAPRHHSEWYP